MKVDGLAADLQALRERPGDDPLSLGTIIDSLGTRGFGVLLFLLSLPSALPVPAPGYSTPFGLLIAGLGLQMLLGKQAPVLPNWALARTFGRDTSDKLFGAGIRFLRKTEALVKPRFAFMGSKGGRASVSILVILMAGLMILPIPLTNTFPAMVIFMIGVALTEQDGLIMVLSAVAGWLAIAAYAAVIYAVYYLGTTSFDEVKELIKFWN